MFFIILKLYPVRDVLKVLHHLEKSEVYASDFFVSYAIR